MAKKKVIKESDRVAVLTMENGSPLILRANPTTEEVRGFVAEHNRRSAAGEAGGPDGWPARRVVSAAFHDTEDDLKNGTEIDISEED